jgi:hypothetical protein
MKRTSLYPVFVCATFLGACGSSAGPAGKTTLAPAGSQLIGVTSDGAYALTVVDQTGNLVYVPLTGGSPQGGSFIGPQPTGAQAIGVLGPAPSYPFVAGWGVGSKIVSSSKAGLGTDPVALHYYNLVISADWSTMLVADGTAVDGGSITLHQNLSGTFSTGTQIGGFNPQTYPFLGYAANGLGVIGYDIHTAPPVDYIASVDANANVTQLINTPSIDPEGAILSGNEVAFRDPNTGILYSVSVPTSGAPASPTTIAPDGSLYFAGNPGDFLYNRSAAPTTFYRVSEPANNPSVLATGVYNLGWLLSPTISPSNRYLTASTVADTTPTGLGYAIGGNTAVFDLSKSQSVPIAVSQGAGNSFGYGPSEQYLVYMDQDDFSTTHWLGTLRAVALPSGTQTTLGTHANLFVFTDATHGLAQLNVTDSTGAGDLYYEDLAAGSATLIDHNVSQTFIYVPTANKVVYQSGPTTNPTGIWQATLP